MNPLVDEIARNEFERSGGNVSFEMLKEKAKTNLFEQRVLETLRGNAQAAIDVVERRLLEEKSKYQRQDRRVIKAAWKAVKGS